MTKVEIVRDLRETLDRQNPGWRAALRKQMDAEHPGWVVATATVRADDGRLVEVALLANPERVPEPGEADDLEAEPTA